jgi:hypothetical protein
VEATRVRWAGPRFAELQFKVGAAPDLQLKEERVNMSDVVFVAITIVFFAAAWAYTRGCDRL